MNWLTVMLGALATAAPQLLPMIPQPYAAIVTALIGAGTGIYHLFRPKP